MDKSPPGSVLSMEEAVLCKEGVEKQDKKALKDRQVEVQGEITEIRDHYEQELSKLQENVRVSTKNCESTKIEIKLLRQRVHDFDEIEKQLYSLRKLNKKSHVCIHCSDLFQEICKLESDMGIIKKVEALEITPGEALTHHQNETILKQYLNSLRQLTDIFLKAGEVDNLQAEVASLTYNVELLKKQFGEKKPDAAAQLLLEQKDLDICDLKAIIVKLQAEKEVVYNDMKEAILALNCSENKVAQLTDSLAQLTQDEMKFKSNIFEKEKLCNEVKRTAGQEADGLDGMINQILTLTEHLQKQITQLKTTASVECGQKLSDIYSTANKLKEAEKDFKNNLILNMSMEDVGNKQIEAFAQKVSFLNQHRTDLERGLIEHLASYVESNKLKDDNTQKFSELLEERSKGNVNLKYQLAVKSQEKAQSEYNKDEQIFQLQKQLDKMTLGQKLTDNNESQSMKEKDKKILLLKKQVEIVTEEKIEAQKTIIARDEELTSILTQGDFKVSAMERVPKSTKKAAAKAKKPVPATKKPALAAKKPALAAKKTAPEAGKPMPATKKLVPAAKKPMVGAKSKFKNPVDNDEELRLIN